MAFIPFSFLTGKNKKNDDKERDVEDAENKEKDYFLALISSLIRDEKEGYIESKTITIKNARDAQLIITNIIGNESMEDVFDRVLHFLGARFNPESAGLDFLALDPLVERIFIKKTQNEPIEYPVFDVTGKPALTAVLKSPLILVARKGLRTVLFENSNGNRVQNDRLYIPININMSGEQTDTLVTELYRHRAVKVYTRSGVMKSIGMNPDITLIDAVMPHIVPGYPSFSPLEWEMASKTRGMKDTIYVWLEVTDRNYYNKVLTQISEIISKFCAGEVEKHKVEKDKNEKFELEMQTAVFVTRSGIGGEICSLIPFIGSGYLFSSTNKVVFLDDSYANMNMKKISSMGIELKPNQDV